ncbi:hypothetical protein NPIL_296651 [Nephila pilipes]|uniref:Uncharacterized protein n=1 Tax=Nephila pilipes TaxID=299642 RepID=A0A8X6QBH6_NEPPI|nr:hypothetical protein NPIL_296651 [Nephila pilipes]
MRPLRNQRISKCQTSPFSSSVSCSQFDNKAGSPLPQNTVNSKTATQAIPKDSLMKKSSSVQPNSKPFINCIMVFLTIAVDFYSNLIRP